MDEKQVFIDLRLSVDEVNTVLRTLAKHPFEEVAALIGRIKATGEEQVAAQVQAQQAETPAAE